MADSENTVVKNVKEMEQILREHNIDTSEKSNHASSSNQQSSIHEIHDPGHRKHKHVLDADDLTRMFFKFI